LLKFSRLCAITDAAPDPPRPPSAASSMDFEHVIHLR
jgi:hypothetical protein